MQLKTQFKRVLKFLTSNFSCICEHPECNSTPMSHLASILTYSPLWLQLELYFTDSNFSFNYVCIQTGAMEADMFEPSVDSVGLISAETMSHPCRNAAKHLQMFNGRC